MKDTLKFLMVALLATSFMFTSCDDDDTTEPENKFSAETVVGEWSLKEIKPDGMPVPISVATVKEKMHMDISAKFIDAKKGQLILKINKPEQEEKVIDKNFTWTLNEKNINITLAEPFKWGDMDLFDGVNVEAVYGDDNLISTNMMIPVLIIPEEYKAMFEGKEKVKIAVKFKKK